MKTSITAWLGSMLLAIFVTSVASADDHMLNGIDMQQPFNVQANLCKLNPDVTLDDYHALVEDYFDWAENNSVDPVFVRQFPLFSHQNLRNPWPYDFVELLGVTTSVGASLGIFGSPLKMAWRLIKGGNHLRCAM